jgi:peroxiredoxin
MIRCSASLFLLTFFIHTVFSAETKISGTIPGGEGYEVRLIAYSDYISYSEILLDRTFIDSAGDFSLSTDITETQDVYLDLDYYYTTFYLEPGEDYHLQFDSISMADQYRPYYEKEPLVFQIVSEDQNELNNLIFEFNEIYNDFLATNFQSIYNRRNNSLIESFRSEMNFKYAGIENQYFKSFVEFKIASVELSANGSNKPQLFKKYLFGKPILYSHAAYMEFFNQFFDQYLTTGNKFISEKDLEKGINELISLPALMDSLGKDTLLMSESLRELVLIKGMKELYFSPYYYQQNILNILDQITATSHFPLHRAIAKNIRESLTKLQKGTVAPDFSLKDLSGDSINLTECLGKPVYLSFLTTWTYACLAEFRIMDSLYSVWGSKINFITVLLDKNTEVVSRFKKEKNYNWTFLYNGSGYDLIQAYGIKTFPLFVLIDSSGKILQYPAVKPSEGMGDVFTYMEQKSKE